jgi:hypothetical protein
MNCPKNRNDCSILFGEVMALTRTHLEPTTQTWTESNFFLLCAPFFLASAFSVDA